jgi:hypothetical protein
MEKNATSSMVNVFLSQSNEAPIRSS